MERIGLFGAAGATGKSVAAALRAEGTPYRVVGRSRRALEEAFGGDPLAEIVTWDPADPASVRAAARGVGTAFHLVGVPYTDFGQHPVVMRQLLEGAVAEGVERILLVGNVYLYGLPRTEPVREDHPREPHTFKGRMRKEQEEILFSADAAGRIRATVLRLPDFYGPSVASSYVHSAFVAAATGGRAQLIGPIDVRHEFVFVPDVGPAALALSREAAAYGRTWHFAGPGPITQRQMVEKAFSYAGTRPRWTVFGPTAVRLLGIFSPFLREVSEMRYLFENPVLLDDSALRGLLPGLRKTPYDEGIRLSVDAARRQAGKG